MQVQIYSPEDDASTISGFTVVVDVFRAFSTAYYIASNEPIRYFLTDSIDTAYQRKREEDRIVLIGERGGKKIRGFDYGNSPTEIYRSNFIDKIIVHTTTAGTKGVLAQPEANEVVVGSFVNVQALIDYIQDRKFYQINIYCTAMPGKVFGEEDYLFADYLKARLMGDAISFEKIVSRLRTGSGVGFLDESFAPYTDFLLCMDIDRFNFVLKRQLRGGRVELVRDVKESIV